jgi:predicted DsbA family dithiol-disulfide isomerase
MSPEKLDSFINGVQTAGSRHGIAFAVHGPTGPSQSSHRLTALTLRTLGPLAQAQVVEALFRGHFERGMDVSDSTWLVAVGRSVGLQEKDVLKVLRCEDMGRELEGEVRGAMRGGVEAVPSVLVGGRFRVGGYQSADLFEGVFDSYVREQSEGLPMTATAPTVVHGAPDSDWLRLVNERMASRER